MYNVENKETPKARGKKSIYPFTSLDFGESFIVPVDDSNAIKIQRKMSALAASYWKRHKKKFITRRIEEGIRVIRVIPADVQAMEIKEEQQ